MRYKILILTILCSLCYTASQAQWKKVYGSTSQWPVGLVFCFNDHILIRDDKGIYLSNDNGKTWNLVDSSYAMQTISKIISKDSLLIAASDKVYTSLDSGKTWKEPSSWPFKYSDIRDIVVSGNNILGASIQSSYINKIIISKDNGASWDTGKRNLPFVLPYKGSINALGVIGNTTLAFYVGTLYVSYDHGENWQYGADSCPQNSPVTFHNKIFAPHLYKGMEVSKDSGLHWKNIFRTKQGVDNVGTICTDGKILIAPVYYEGVVFSSDSGQTWVFKNDGLDSYKMGDISMNSDYVFVGGNNGQVFRRPLFEITGVRKDPATTIELVALKVYPNPCNQYTIFAFGRALKQGEIKLYDMNGKEVGVYNHINADRYQLARGNLASGTYIYILTENSKKLATGKLQIQSI